MAPQVCIDLRVPSSGAPPSSQAASPAPAPQAASTPPPASGPRYVTVTVPAQGPGPRAVSEGPAPSAPSGSPPLALPHTPSPGGGLPVPVPLPAAGVPVQVVAPPPALCSYCQVRGWGQAHLWGSWESQHSQHAGLTHSAIRTCHLPSFILNNLLLLARLQGPHCMKHCQDFHRMLSSIYQVGGRSSMWGHAPPCRFYNGWAIEGGHSQLALMLHLSCLPSLLASLPLAGGIPGGVRGGAAGVWGGTAVDTAARTPATAALIQKRQEERER